jgi:hypothetical protein
MLGSITITNNTDKIIELETEQDGLVAIEHKTKKHTIAPKEYLVIFTNRIQSLHWDKNKVG